MEDIETEEVTPTVPYSSLYSNIPKAAELINEDADHFLRLTLPQKEQICKAIKRLKPQPEFKEDHKWLCEWMREEIDEEVGGNGVGSVDFVVDQTTGIIVDEPESNLKGLLPEGSMPEMKSVVTDQAGPTIVSRVSADSVKIATSVENAEKGIAVDIVSAPPESQLAGTTDLEAIAQFCEDQIGEIVGKGKLNNYQNSRRLAFVTILRMIRTGGEVK